MLYEIKSIKHGFEQIVDFIKFRDVYYSFFIEGKKEGIKPDFFDLTLKAQNGFKKDDFKTLDYLDCSSSIPIFSARFVDNLQKEIKNEMDFFPCKISYKDDSYKFYLGRIKKNISLLDEENSGVFTLSDGSTMPDEPYFYNNIENNFMIARDEKWKNIFLISENLKNLMVLNNYNIDFKKVNIKNN